MRWRMLPSSSILLPAIQAAADGLSPFVNPSFGILHSEALGRRQACEDNGVQCTNVGVEQACCPENYLCGSDENGHVACCTENAACTGTVDNTITVNPTGAPTTTGSSTDFVLGTTTLTTDTPQVTGVLSTGVQGGGSTVPNDYYPFVSIPTSYADPELCSTAYSQCQAQSTACFNSVAGGNAVTVSGITGLITQQEGSSGTVLSNSASSICSSLSLRACYGLSEDQCAVFSNGGGATNTGGNVVQPANYGPRQTACPGVIYAAGFGAVAGAMGALA